MNEKIFSAADMMLQAANISPAGANEICSVWKKVVSGVKSYKHDGEDSEKRMPLGERLAGNTRVIDLKNGVLLVESDHPGWIQYLRMYQKFILTGLKMNLPNLKITALAYRVSGEKANLSDSYEQAISQYRREQAAGFEKQEKELAKYEKNFAATCSGKSTVKPAQLPKELLAKFDSIKQSIADDEKN